MENLAPEQVPYWMAFAYTENFTTPRKHEFLDKVLGEKELADVLQAVKKGTPDLFANADEKVSFVFTEEEWTSLQESLARLTNFAFLAEDILNKQIQVIPVKNNARYSDTLKKNFKQYHVCSNLIL